MSLFLEKSCPVVFATSAVASLQVFRSPLSVTGGNPIIGTHNGNFHCDEALACGLLRHVTDFKSANIVRTRDDEHLRQCNIVVDVGAQYDPETLRFDHHQNGFQETMATYKKTYSTKLSSAGLIYRHYGKLIIKEYLDHLKISVTEALVEQLFNKMYQGFVEHVDGGDNGINQFSGENVVQNYLVTTSLPSRVAKLYPPWTETCTDEKEDAGFLAAVELTTIEFFEHLDAYIHSWVPARAVVQKAFEEAQTVHESKRIIAFNEGGCPWKEHLFDIEEEAGCVGRTFYVLFRDAKTGWRVMCVPKSLAGFDTRKPLLWKGLREKELCDAAGIDGCIFVHGAGFIGGNKTFEGAKQMGIKSLEL